MVSGPMGEWITVSLPCKPQALLFLWEYGSRRHSAPGASNQVQVCRLLEVRDDVLGRGMEKDVFCNVPE